MKNQRITQLLVLCVVLLAGIALGQYFQLKQQKMTAEDLKAQVLAELRGGAGSAAPAAAGEPVAQLAQRDTRDRELPELIEPITPAEPLSPTEYWISTDYSDDKPHGFSAWLELVPNGHFILEQCFAPDYSAEVSAEQDPYRAPTCKLLIDTRIVRISDTEIVLRDNASMPIILDVSTEPHTLSLTLDDNRIELTPGQKNTLWEGLSSLPSVQEAHQAAWKEHVELREQPQVPGQ